MKKTSSFKKIWSIPAYLGGITLFGLLAALLGTGYWYPLAWAAITLPLGVIVYQVNRHQKKKLV